MSIKPHIQIKFDLDTPISLNSTHDFSKPIVIVLIYRIWKIYKEKQICKKGQEREKEKELASNWMYVADSAFKSL